MTRSLLYSFIAIITLVAGATRARADATADRSAVADAFDKLAGNAEALARTAKASEDRAVRKKFASQAAELADDLAALARRARKDVPYDALVKDAVAAGKDAAALIDVADDAEDKDERKSLRAQATVLEQGIAAARKSIETLAAKKDEKKPPAKPAAMPADAFRSLVGAIK